jgi:hypothetical protein
VKTNYHASVWCINHATENLFASATLSAFKWHRRYTMKTGFHRCTDNLKNTGSAVMRSKSPWLDFSATDILEIKYEKNA